ncbi:16S rRNA (guanine(527)-N(7))-methyltransferase GidB [Sphaerochaeta pleomorpha str. Grapes]|uniref:Ribosomal RNA small subunit methyltransferase G n=1 Tax=Sphaerochaeta pleomorpha (strain ATCC BAA-1885 / DSM 22778 / Grapes) TaxID=158190 RepID=G8QSN6_SPHPG|nr:16S rRNA (guanine(527)-N(7))-methyltransferase RsmG [Sphaerochaeta pleomorpha]AEV28997.1 16S rRNA (guanine(527)-N(7))-methyltransferase GidB [Sphaerochaeta pleomorpha str. Grapes]
MATYDNLLHDSIDQLGLQFDDTQYAQLSTYIKELELWNPTYKLVGASGNELITKHIVDSLSSVPTILDLLSGKQDPTIADLGSGAGLPGIPLAIALRDYRFTLVERMGRRVGFLNNALVLCRLSDRVSVYDQDLSQVKGSFDLVTFRAFHPLYDILDAVEPILAPDGVICAYKGQEDQLRMELEQVEKQCKSKWTVSQVSLSVPYLDAQRMLCILHKG